MRKKTVTPRYARPISPDTFLSLFTLSISLLSSSSSSLCDCLVQSADSPQKPPPLPVLPIPTSRQIQWQSSSMALFLHFGPNTFTDTEWGSGHADPSVFNPTRLDAAQWVGVAKQAGFSRVILTAKHHDGFCLWPSQYTDYSVRSSPWRGGRGDVVAELSSAARDAGVGLGLYLSPWDRHEPSYGRTLDYNEFYMGQMAELLTRYGEIKEVWLDGAKGEGEKDMDYYFESWFSLIRQLQPGAVIFSDAGPDTRWIGDEAGVAGSTCWSPFNRSSAKIGGTDPQYSRSGDPVGHDWVPAECDVSIRPGWFWHASEVPKSARTLLDIYYNSVGRNCLLLLNVPPNSLGLISKEDIQVLQEFNELRRSIFDENLAKSASLSASGTRGGMMNSSHFSPDNVLKEGIYSYWAPEENQSDWTLHLRFQEKVKFNVLQVQEPIQLGQRVIQFHLETLSNGEEWRQVINGTTVGYQRLLQFPMLETQELRFVIDKSRGDPLISYLGIYIDSFSILTETPTNTSQTHANGSRVIMKTAHDNHLSATL